MRDRNWAHISYQQYINFNDYHEQSILTTISSD